jgi:hypothetical protein
LTKHISRHLYPEFLLVQPEDIELNLSQDVWLLFYLWSNIRIF